MLFLKLFQLLWSGGLLVASVGAPASPTLPVEKTERVVSRTGTLTPASSTSLPARLQNPGVQAVRTPHPPNVSMFPDGTPSPTRPASQAFEGAFSFRKALESLYPPGQIWFTADGLAHTRLVAYKGEAGVYTATLNARLVAPYVQGGVQKYVIFAETALPMTCHACPAVVGGAVFAKTSRQWQVETRVDELTLSGASGHAPRGKLVRIGAERYGFMFQYSYANTGHGVENLVLYAPVEHEIRKIVDLQIGRTQFFDPRWGYTATYKFVPGKNPQYDDLHLKITGTKMVDGQILAVQETHIYVFDGLKYQML